MALISRLGVVLGLDSAEFTAGLGKAEASLGKFSTLAKGVGVGSVAALAYELINTSKAAIDFADKINDVAKANEVTTSSILKLSNALVINGGESDTAGKLFSSFTNKVDEAAGGSKKAQESFAKLGITLKDLSELSQQQLFDKAMRGLADPRMNDVITRNAVAMDLWGKAVKGVDIDGLAQDYLNNQDNFNNANKAFKDIGDSMDKLDKASFKLKTSLAENISPYFTATINYLDKVIFGYDELIKRKNTLENKGAPAWKAQPLMTDKPDAGAFNLPAEFKAGVRNVTDPMAEEKAKKAAAAAEAFAKKLQNQTEQLRQQVKLYQLQKEEIGEQKSEYQKALLEFEKGGKYADIKNQKEKESLLNAAKALDTARDQAEINKINYDIEVARAIELGNLYEQGRLITEDIKERKILQQESADAQVRELQIQVDKIEYAKQLVGLSDTQEEKAQKLYDLSRETIEMYRKGDFTDDQISAIIEAKRQSILAEEEYQRAQNTFQAGWSKAYENFAEKAKDSAALGAQAFDSMSSSINGAIDSFVENGKLSFSSLIQSMIKDLLKFMLKAQASKIFSDSGSFFSFGKIFSGLGFADGGSPPVNQMSLVGERGPELFIPNTAGTIIPNNQLSNVLGGGEKVVYNGPYIANMQAIDMKSFEDRLYQSHNAIWAANQYAGKSLAVGRGRT